MACASACGGDTVELSAFICTDARLTHDGGLDLLGVFNELFAPAFPARHGRLVLAALLVWDAEEHGRVDFRVDLEDSAGTSVFTVDGHTEVMERAPPAPPPKTQLVLPLHDVLFPSAGRYRFKFVIAGQHVHGPSLFVLQRMLQERL
jgi:Family of unknown function (DUF6941)